jgi:hypothetical protein
MSLMSAHIWTLTFALWACKIAQQCLRRRYNSAVAVAAERAVGLAAARVARIVGGVLRGRLDVVGVFSDFVYLFTEADSPEWLIGEVPDGVASAVDGMLAVPVATDTGPVRVSLERHDRNPPALEAGVREDIGVLTWRPVGRRLRLGDTVGQEVDRAAAADEAIAGGRLVQPARARAARRRTPCLTRCRPAGPPRRAWSRRW